jgi:glutathione peroxidase
VKPFLIVLFVLLLAVGTGVVLAARKRVGGAAQVAPADVAGGSLWDLGARTLSGEPADLGEYRGQVALVVNVASKCGFTPQYGKLEALHRELSPRGFTVLGFPSNDFGGQEPGTAREIRTFCSTTYGVTFPVFEKGPVKGEERSDVYRLLTEHLEEPSWNFTKYLVGRDGRVLARFAPKTEPDDPELRRAVEEALGPAGGRAAVPPPAADR